MLDLIVFPSSYFNNKYVDEEFLDEYESVKNTGLFSLALFGYNEWYSKQKLSLDKAIEKNTRAVYRGWMMKPEEYALFTMFFWIKI